MGTRFIYFVTVLLSITCLLSRTDAKAVCYLPEGRAFVKNMLIGLAVTGRYPRFCSKECELGGGNWRVLADSVNKELLSQITDSDSDCPKPGWRFPFPIDGARRIGRMVSAPDGFSYQFFMTSLLPDLCNAACISGKSRLFVPSYTWKWGGANKPGLLVICHNSYDARENKCRKRGSLSVIENTDRYFQSVCDCYSKGQCF